MSGGGKLTWRIEGGLTPLRMVWKALSGQLRKNWDMGLLEMTCEGGSGESTYVGGV